jgi:hypothetical protein
MQETVFWDLVPCIFFFTRRKFPEDGFLQFCYCFSKLENMAYSTLLVTAVRQNGKSGRVSGNSAGRFIPGDLISAPVDVNTTAELYSRTCSL